MRSIEHVALTGLDDRKRQGEGGGRCGSLRHDEEKAAFAIDGGCARNRHDMRADGAHTGFDTPPWTMRGHHPGTGALRAKNLL
ncbi:hypothetical protein Busp01_16340 [Trinickia caryophylli]|nr:hypothetical protein Busp01_16340 [Trinickia caryophylli]